MLSFLKLVKTGPSARERVFHTSKLRHLGTEDRKAIAIFK